MDHLIKPHGGVLRNPLVDEARATQLKKDAQAFPAITLTQRQLCDLELLMNGAFSPLRGFMTREVYENVLEKMRLPDTFTPSPLTGEGGDGGDTQRRSGATPPPQPSPVKGEGANKQVPYQAPSGGLLWSIPITLDVPDAIAEKLQPGSRLALNDAEGFMLAVLRVADKWKPDKTRETELGYRHVPT